MSSKAPSSRNKTLTLTNEESEIYAAKSLVLTEKVTSDQLCNKTVCGDLFDTAKYLPDSFADLLIADPPYNITKTFGESVFRRSTEAEYRAYTEAWINAVKHTLKPEASIYVCCDWYSSLVIGDVLSKHFTIRNRITWQREKGRGSHSNWKNSCEDIWFATVGGKYKFNSERVKLRRKVIAPYKDNGAPKDWTENEYGKFRDTYASNFWDDISVPFWSMPENTSHPTQKPEKLVAKLILASSDENDFVFDPFMGSGTVPVTAKKLSRRYLGTEREKMYCALAEKRIEQADTDTRIQGYEDNVFWERNTLINKQIAERNKI